MPVLAVDAITHRPEPRVPFCVEGTGVGYGQNSSSTLQTAAAGPDATLGLQAAGFDVSLAVPWRVYLPDRLGHRDGPPVSRLPPRASELHLHDLGMLHIDFFVFVDADVDPLNPRAVLTAIAL